MFFSYFYNSEFTRGAFFSYVRTKIKPFTFKLLPWKNSPSKFSFELDYYRFQLGLCSIFIMLFEYITNIIIKQNKNWIDSYHRSPFLLTDELYTYYTHSYCFFCFVFSRNKVLIFELFTQKIQRLNIVTILIMIVITLFELFQTITNVLFVKIICTIPETLEVNFWKETKSNSILKLIYGAIYGLYLLPNASR